MHFVEPLLTFATGTGVVYDACAAWWPLSWPALHALNNGSHRAQVNVIKHTPLL